MLLKFKLLFWLRRNQPTKEGLIPIYLRVSIAGTKPAEISTGINIHPLQWDSARQCIRGRSDSAKLNNIQLAELKNKILMNFITLQATNKNLTATDVKNGYASTDVKCEQVTKALQLFMEHEKKQITEGKKIKEATYKNKENFCMILLEYAKKTPAMTVDNITARWAKRFFDWLILEKQYKPSYVCNIRVFVKEFTKYCFDLELLDEDPLHNLNYVIKREQTEIVYTPVDEINLIKKYEWTSENEVKAAHLYQLCCNTGLSYSDAQRLDPLTDIILKDDMKWIDMSRIKTNINFLIPLLPDAEQILNTYNGVPNISLSTYNKVLKRISLKLNLNKRLSSHKGRKSFSMLVQEAYNMPTEAASLMLGHTNENVTKKHYTAKKVNNVRREKAIVFGNELMRLAIA